MTDDNLTGILSQVGAGERAGPELMEALYTELRAIAERLMKSERGNHTLQPTALVHEAFLRLVDSERVGEHGHLHFLSAAAVAMRRVLVDHARGQGAVKRGGGEPRERVKLGTLAVDDSGDDLDVLAWDTAKHRSGGDVQSPRAALRVPEHLGSLSRASRHSASFSAVFADATCWQSTLQLAATSRLPFSPYKPTPPGLEPGGAVFLLLVDRAELSS